METTEKETMYAAKSVLLVSNTIMEKDVFSLKLKKVSKLEAMMRLFDTIQMA